IFSTRAPGTATRIAATTAPVSASPHNAATRAPARTPGAASTGDKADGTALIKLPAHGPALPRSASASRFGTTSRHPPDASVPKTSNTDTSKLRDVAARTRDNSPPANTAAAQHASDTTPACSTTTPFGRPVDPDVYTTYAGCPGRSGLPRSGSARSPAGYREITSPTAGSSRMSGAAVGGRDPARLPVVSTMAARVSVSMNAIRSGGNSGSTGT